MSSVSPLPATPAIVHRPQPIARRLDRLAHHADAPVASKV